MQITLASIANIQPVHLLIPFRLVAFAAPDSAIHPLVIQSLAQRAERDECVGVILGNNHFDLYALSRLAHDHGFDAEQVLTRIQLSRAFTCHQLHHRVITLDREFTRPWRALYVLGLLNTFCDESVPDHEAARLLNDTLTQLKQIARSGLTVLVTFSLPKKPGRESLATAAARAADDYWEFVADAATPLVVDPASPREEPTRRAASDQLAMPLRF